MEETQVSLNRDQYTIIGRITESAVEAEATRTEETAETEVVEE